MPSVAIGPRKPRQQIVLALQGGGALGAFSVGAASELIAHPDIEVMQFTGTSSGGISACAFGNGYAYGLAHGGIEAARHYAIKNAELTWRKAADFQIRQLPFWYSASNAYFAQLPAEARSLFKNAAREHGARHQTEAPLLEFYRYLESVDGLCPAASTQSPLIAVNTTVHHAGHSIWNAAASDERVHILNGYTLQQQHRFVAASGCLDFSKPIDIQGDGILHHDGAYSSPFPDPLGTAKFCHENGYALVVLRTRPTGAFAFGNCAEHSEDWMRAYFNLKMDTAIEKIRAAYPCLKLHVIEPETVEQERPGFLNNEMSFDRDSIERRMAEGHKRAAEIMKGEMGLAPIAQPKAEAPKEKSGLVVDAMAAAASFMLAYHPAMAWMNLMTAASPVRGTTLTGMGLH